MAAKWQPVLNAEALVQSAAFGLEKWWPPAARPRGTPSKGRGSSPMLFHFTASHSGRRQTRETTQGLQQKERFAKLCPVKAERTDPEVNAAIRNSWPITQHKMLE